MDYEKKDFRKLYEDLVKSDWFKRAYHNKSLGECPFDIPELAESEDERTRKWLLDYAIEMIAGLESDISLSNYDGIKGHDPEAEAELAQWQKARAYLEKQKDLDKMIVVSPEVWDKAINDAYENGKKDGEKQKEPHYTKRNALFDKCVENCDPTVMKKVSDEVDEMLEKEQKPAEHSAKGRRGRMGGIPEYVRRKAEAFKDKMEPPYDANDICTAYEAGALESAKPAELEQLAKLREMTHEIRDAYERGIEVGRVESKQEWSEEDEKMLRTIISDGSRGVELDSKQISWLKSLRPQSKKELSIEKAIQWLDDTFYFLNNSSGRGRDCEITTHDFDSLEEMYDSFRKAVTVDSEPSWKPSEEQMESLAYAIQVLNSNPHPKSAKAYQDLQTLYKNIKYGN